MIRASIDEIEEASAAVKFGKEDGGVSLSIWGFDPVEAWFDAAFFTATFAKDPATVTAYPHDLECVTACFFF